MTFLMTVVTFSIAQAQRSFYVSSTGNDGNNGIFPSSAWKTLNKVNSASLTAGDVFYVTSNARGKSGQDNAVRFDESMLLKNNKTAFLLNQESVDLNSFLYVKKNELSKIALLLAL
ncbi:MULTISPECIES: hypothetical protein [Flavobacterium]|uniref:Uncharacterized protein n=1 Tax=Flavobacterium jumunjinense TaxID=998845 RepID=A0ABV5GJG3_9FLAO|nr:MULTISPECIES: hypothetical protein [Flavobacterium]